VPNDLDSIDLKILSELQRNGRIPNSDLAFNVGVSPTSCLRRVRALRESGYIKGFRALLDEKMLGLGITAFVAVKLTSQADQRLTDFELSVRDLPHVQDCWLVAGGADYVLKCVAHSVSELEAQLLRFASLPNVRNVKSLLMLRKTKEALLPVRRAVQIGGAAR
jgi:DNA-binding Lrp family transcriptional regulator